MMTSEKSSFRNPAVGIIIPHGISISPTTIEMAERVTM
jgi:hypothetical protein